MTPHIIAHRVAFVANAAAGGDLLAKAELAMAISALFHISQAAVV